MQHMAPHIYEVAFTLKEKVGVVRGSLVITAMSESHALDKGGRVVWDTATRSKLEPCSVEITVKRLA